MSDDQEGAVATQIPRCLDQGGVEAGRVADERKHVGTVGEGRQCRAGRQIVAVVWIAQHEFPGLDHVDAVAGVQRLISSTDHWLRDAIDEAERFPLVGGNLFQRDGS